MSDDSAKQAKKLAKADVKRQKKAAATPSSGVTPLPEGVSVSVQRRANGTELVVSGLREEQLERLLPDITREVMITVTEEKSRFKAGVMRFVREGLFETIVKIVAGLVVGILLLEWGFK